MRKFYLIVVLLSMCASGFAQSYSLRIHGRVNHEGDKCAETEMRFYVYYEGDTEPELVTSTIDANYDETIVRNRKMVRIETDSYRLVKTGLLASCSLSGNGRIYKDFDGDRCFNQTYIQGVDDGEIIFKTKFNGELNVEYRPLIVVDKINDGEPIGYDSEYTLTATPGLATANYNWQYQFYANGNLPNKFNWKSIVASPVPHVLKFKPEDYLEGEEFDMYDDWKVSFRLNQCELKNDSDESHSIKYSAPRFEDYESTTDVTCFGGNDGTVTFRLSRQFRDGEKLALKVINLDTDPEGESSVSQLNDVILGTDRTVTIETLPVSPGPKRFRAIFFSGGENFTGDPDHVRDFTINGPKFVSFEVTNVTNVNCKGGNDGTISVSAADGKTDGTYEYAIFDNPIPKDIPEEKWQQFSNVSAHLETGKNAGTYYLAVRDENHCLAEDWEFNSTTGVWENRGLVIDTVTIEEPKAALHVRILKATRQRGVDSDSVSAYGFTDGRVRAIISGGTPPYNLVWQTDDGTSPIDYDLIEEDEKDEHENSIYSSTLRNIGAGTYSLTVTDNKHTIAAIGQKTACEDFAELEIGQPEPLALTLLETNSISCNNGNEFIDTSDDGELTANASGGIELKPDIDNNFMPYIYTWKQEIDGMFETLDVPNDSILRDVSMGRYSVNIEDANGIILGEYVNNVLVNPEDVYYNLQQPDPIVISFETGNIACHGGSEGWARATIIGGTGSFELRWSNGMTSERIDNLKEGRYFIYATDEKGCQANAAVDILAPDSLSIETTELKNPTCNDGADGRITTVTSGGVGPYAYQWINETSGVVIGTPNVIGSGTTEGDSVEGLIAGTYSVTVTDTNGCSLTRQFILENPPPNLIELGEDRLLCGGQSVIVDASFPEEGTTYSWTSDNGFTSNDPIIEISEAGTYTVSLNTPLGCTGGDSITIATSEAEIDAHFVVSTQAFAGEEVALINISSPLGETVEWYFPPEAEVIVETDEDVVLVFEEPGAYDIILRSTQGECYLDFMKSIIVEEAEDIADIGDAQNPFISEFIVSPNPSDGNFKVDIELAENSEISLKMFSMATQGLLNHREEPPATEFSLDYGVALASGSYILLLETAKGSEIRKVLIK